MVKLGSFLPGDAIQLENGNYFNVKYGEMTPEQFRKINETEMRLQSAEYENSFWKRISGKSMSYLKIALLDLKRILRS